VPGVLRQSRDDDGSLDNVLQCRVVESVARAARTLRARGRQSTDMLGDGKFMSDDDRLRPRSIPGRGAGSTTCRFRQQSKDDFTCFVQLSLRLLCPAQCPTIDGTVAVMSHAGGVACHDQAT